jgi:hypothetical protein
MSNSDFIQVEVVGFAPAQQAGGFVVFLKQQGDTRCLPIVVGAAEAQAISLIFNPQEPERPMTHDTFKNILDALRGQIKRILITRLEEHTFFADIWLVNASGDNFHLDARPSDAIALALKNNAPICVVRELMNTAGIDMPEEPKKPEKKQARKKLSQIEDLEAKLQKALEEENYEEAARLRDELRKLKGKDTPPSPTPPAPRPPPPPPEPPPAETPA